MLAGLLIGLATLTRVDGLILAVAPAAAWVMRMREVRPAARARRSGSLPRLACLMAMAPWLARNVATFGAALPSAGGHTLWITSYNEQFSIGHEVSLGTYLDWGLPRDRRSKVASLAELAGRTLAMAGGVFALFFVGGAWVFRRQPELRPFLAYWVVMFLAMGLLFTFHAPKGAFVHSAPAWLPMAFAIAVGGRRPGLDGRSADGGRSCAGRGRIGSCMGASLVAAIVLSLARLCSAAGVLARRERAPGRWRPRSWNAAVPRDDVVMFADPARLHLLTGHPGVSPPFDPFVVVEEVVRAYDVRWVVVTLEPGETRDALGLWDGAAGVDSDGASPGSCRPSRPTRRTAFGYTKSSRNQRHELGESCVIRLGTSTSGAQSTVARPHTSPDDARRGPVLRRTRYSSGTHDERPCDRKRERAVRPHRRPGHGEPPW